MFVYIIHTVMGEEFEDISDCGVEVYLDCLNDDANFILCEDSEGNTAIVRKDQISYVETVR